ncbi:unnamed protein product [Pseudo-nitzschia multistriata]|uniref:Uncharacterized protein n=1 Tax=Pseudo-nitzschia multistriata TaxID=183589 RepID=A0A448YUF6_9STRA|nr:unnamed protein product [Pseudo-nitzschia multistriata]
MDWLTDTLSTPPEKGTGATGGNMYSDENMADASPYLEEHSVEGDLGDVPIPTTGLSVSDEMGKTQKDRFYSQLVPITGLGKGVKALRILSSTSVGAYEAVRYLIRLNRKEDEEEEDVDLGLDFDEIDLEMYLDDDDEVSTSDSQETSSSLSSGERDDFVMVDIPPFSEKLLKEMKSVMGPNGRLSAILVTSQECIHYDEAPGVYSVRKADLTKWKREFPETATVAYRMDIPRDCRDSITQRLDGYGPWAMVEEPNETGKIDTGSIFKESGLPFTVNEWDPEMAEDIMTGKRKPPGEEEDDDSVIELDANGGFTPDTIRANEEGKQVLAVYTPGRTFGSTTYVFPELKLCASGYSLPLEDSREEENPGMDSPGPALDHRGYITTNKAGVSRQVESARELVENYHDRFEILLTARGDPFYFEGDARDRRETLMEIIGQYEKLGNIYEQLGITGN